MARKKKHRRTANKHKRVIIQPPPEGEQLFKKGQFLIAGIDPGKTGAIAILNEKYELVDCVTIKGRIDTLILILNKYDGQLAAVLMERNHSRPHDGVRAAFTFGMWTGMKVGVLRAYGMPVTYITPQQWMRILGITAGLDKKERKKLVRDTVTKRVALGERKVPLLAFDAIGIAVAGLDILYGRDKEAQKQTTATTK